MTEERIEAVDRSSDMSGVQDFLKAAVLLGVVIASYAFGGIPGFLLVGGAVQHM